MVAPKNIISNMCSKSKGFYKIYVNEKFISIKVGDKELGEEELSELATQMYEICKNTEAVRQVIEGFEKEYEANPNRDGTLIILTNQFKDLERESLNI